MEFSSRMVLFKTFRNLRDVNVKELHSKDKIIRKAIAKKKPIPYYIKIIYYINKIIALR